MWEKSEEQNARTQKIQKQKTSIVAKRKRGNNETEVLEVIRLQLRKVQNITGCSTRTLNCTLQHLQPFLIGCVNMPKNKFKTRRVRARKQSRVKRLLHGCIGCNKYVFGPKEKIKSCSSNQGDHPRHLVRWSQAYVGEMG